MLNQIIIGYDIRNLAYDFSKTWTHERIDKFLIRKKQVRPLSTDVSVWSSFFDEESPPDIRTRNNVALWRNLQLMINIGTQRAAKEDTNLIAIAITLFRDPELRLDYLDLSDIHPINIESDWVFLGYDISDKFLLSSLTNCASREKKSDNWRQTYTDHLNEFHLFMDLGIALDFRNRSNERVKEHSPFYVYGIYSITELLQHDCSGQD